MRRSAARIIPGVLFCCFIIAGFCNAAERGIRIAPVEENLDRRLALVIGNGSYEESPLANPINDARAMAKTLAELGFEVINRENASMTLMMESIQEFGKKLRKGGTGLFYFAGHGIQSNGENYLIPVRSGIEFEEHLRYKAVNLGEVLAEMEIAKNNLNIVIVDACRNNPFKRSFRSISQGLAYVNAPAGTLVAYATAPGSVARDGDRKNGVYTEELVRNMLVPGLRIEDVFKRTRKSLQLKTNNQQIPWESSSLVGDFFFIPPARPEIVQSDGLQSAQSPSKGSLVNPHTMAQPGSEIVQPPSSQSRSEESVSIPDIKSQTSPAVSGTIPTDTQQFTSLHPSPAIKAKANSKPRRDPPYKLAFLPWKLQGSAGAHLYHVLNPLLSSAAETKLFSATLSFYEVDEKYGYKVIDKSVVGKDGNIWKTGSEISPNIESICALAQKLDIDVVIVGYWFVLMAQGGQGLISNDIKLYIIDVQARKMMSVENHHNISITQGAFSSFINQFVDGLMEKYKNYMKSGWKY